MPRIRTIKPEFCTSGQIAECSRNARLLFVLMWMFCDDNGIHSASPKQLRMQCFPGDDDMTVAVVTALVDELLEQKLLVEYEHGGERFWAVTGWKHQRIDKPQPGKYPLPTDENSKVIRGFQEHSWNALGTLPPDRKGEDRKGEDQGSRKGGEGNGAVANALPPDLPEWVVEPWKRFMDHIFAKTGQHLTFACHDSVLMEVLRRGPEKGLRDIEFSIQKNCKTLRDSDNDYEKRGSGGSGPERKTRGQRAMEAMGL